MPDNAQDIGATIDNRVKSLIRKRVDEYAKELESKGVDPSTAKAMAEARESIANHIVNAAKGEIIQGLGGESQGNTAYHTTSIRNADDIRRLMANNPEFKQKVEDTGLTPEQLAVLPQGQSISLTADVDGTPSIFELGGGGGNGPGGRRPGGNLWGGKLGSALYGAYLMKRLWSMSAAPGIQESEKYLTGIGAEYDRMAGMMGEGSGISTRMAITAERSGRAASEIYGGFSEFGYQMSGYGNGTLGRAGQYAGLTGGLMGSAFMGIGVLGQMEMLPAGMTAASAGPVALALGAGAVAGFGTMEAINAVAFQGRPVVTPGNMVQAAGAEFGVQKAQFKYLLQGKFNPTAGELRSVMTEEEEIAADNWTDKVHGDNGVSKRITSLNDRLAMASMESPDQTIGAAMRLSQIFGGNLNSDLTQRFGQASLALGLTSQQNLSPAEQYAASMGYQFGSTGYQRAVQSYALSGDVARQNTLAWQGGRVAALGSQIGSALPWSDQYKGAGEELVQDARPDPDPDRNGHLVHPRDAAARRRADPRAAHQPGQLRAAHERLRGRGGIRCRFAVLPDRRAATPGWWARFPASECPTCKRRT